MDFDQVLAGRHSVRGFLETPVSQDLITEIVGLAQQSPSWCNSQAWQLDVTLPPMTAKLSR